MNGNWKLLNAHSGPDSLYSVSKLVSTTTLRGSWPQSHFSKKETAAEGTEVNLTAIIQLVPDWHNWVQCQVCAVPEAMYPRSTIMHPSALLGLLCDSKGRDELDTGMMKFGTVFYGLCLSSLYCLSEVLSSQDKLS